MGPKSNAWNLGFALRFDIRITLVSLAALLLPNCLAIGQSSDPPDKAIESVVASEHKAESRRAYFSYTSDERSERTKGHRWTEEIVECAEGKIRRLVAEDGVPLGKERSSKETERLRSLGENSTVLAKEQQSYREDEDRLQRLLSLLPSAFVFNDGGMDGAFRRIFFRPNDNFSPSSFEERVVHAMSGSILLSPGEHRLHAIDARLQEDVTIGFGLLARINSGGQILMTREEQTLGEWKTTYIQTKLEGKMVFLKTIDLRQDTVHRNFREIPKLSLPQAVGLIMQDAISR